MGFFATFEFLKLLRQICFYSNEIFPFSVYFYKFQKFEALIRIKPHSTLLPKYKVASFSIFSQCTKLLELTCSFSKKCMFHCFYIINYDSLSKHWIRILNSQEIKLSLRIFIDKFGGEKSWTYIWTVESRGNRQENANLKK